MIEPKIYIAKATKNSDGTFTDEKEVEIQEYFSGAKYNAVDGLMFAKNRIVIRIIR